MIYKCFNNKNIHLPITKTSALLRLKLDFNIKLLIDTKEKVFLYNKRRVEIQLLHFLLN